MEQLTKIQIIEETVSFYEKNPRSMNENGECVYNGIYNGDTKTKCAFSRCCTSDSKFREGNNSLNQEMVILLPQYAHIPFDDYFWREIQLIHDSNINWDRVKNKLSKGGIKVVESLKTKYS